MTGTDERKGFQRRIVRQYTFMKFLFVSLSLFAFVAQAQPAPTVRAAHFTEALEKAKAANQDIVVFQRGSDWNTLGESLYRNVWQKPELLTELGEGFVLVAVDRLTKNVPMAPGCSMTRRASTIRRRM